MPTTMPDDRPVALITGASRGLGRACAIQLAQKGYHIIALARTVGALEKLDDEIKSLGSSATLIPVDLKDSDALLNLGPSLAQRFARIDIFIANAGLLGGLSPLAQTSPKIWDAVYDVNVRANHRLVGTLDPILRASKAKVIFVTSGAAKNCKAFWAAYASSKAAIDVMAQCYSKEVEKQGVTVQLFDPGRFQSAMRSEAYPGENPADLQSPEDVAEELIALCA